MCEELRVGPCKWSDAEHDAGGALTPSASPVFGEHLAQLRTVCLRMYIAKGAAGQSLAVMGSAGESISQPARKPPRAWRQACSLTPTDAHREQPRKARHAYSTVWEVFTQWKQTRPAPPAAAPIEVPLTKAAQLTLWHTTTPAGVVEEVVPPDEGRADIVPMKAQPIRGGRMVQHVGGSEGRRVGEE